MHQLRIERRQAGDIEIVELTGVVEPLSFTGLAAALNGIILQGSACAILDCRHVTYISSTELKELLDYARYARARGGDVKCVGLSPIIQQVANLVANGDPLDCFDDLPNALRSFRTLSASSLH
ncbi:MAG TPA: STAS domain-containing protein [Verrucomicrobiae bacterium]|nr:STAS domain-containing protein [Verrucomicrobiae bacterium]